MTSRGWAVVILVLIAAGIVAAVGFGRGDRSDGFDYYVLSLSWSPTYCASSAGAQDPQQCRSERPFAFVVHGLWPQYRQRWPEFCPTEERWVAENTIEGMLDIMPSKKLVIHEWRKHGTCSGLGQDDYFALTRRLFDRVAIPEKYREPVQAVVTSPETLVDDFRAVNPWLEPAMLAVYCGNRRDTARLSEVRICFTRDGAPSPCGANERRGCQARELVLPPTRPRKAS